MARKVRDINMKLKMINKEAKDYGLQSQVGGVADRTPILANNGVTLCRETDSILGQIVVGRENDESKILEKLLSPSSEVVSFMPIVGMGGSGKTTLAKLVYNNEQIGRHFDKKIWVCVSENFQAKGIFKLILQSLMKNNAASLETASRDVIVQKIKEELEGKRYLLVLDDIWSENSKLWDDFLCSLTGISTTCGNWSIVTTRKLQVASNLPARHSFPLKRLSDDDCLCIVKEKAFLGEETPPEFEAIREKIAEGCQGLPLVASVIGGLLRTNTKEEWLSILQKGILNMSGDEYSVMQILKLSFDHLPSPSLKKCFAYCSLFRKDSLMEKKQLIQFWMAEGFFQVNLGVEISAEEIGEKYFDILLQSSLLEEVVNRDGHKCCRLHDLVHDLAKLVSKSETVYLEDGVVDDHNCQIRHIVVHSVGEETERIMKERLGLLRTLFLYSRSLSYDMWLNSKYLRVLDLSMLKNMELPISVSKLIHLRYLDLSHSNIKALPESLCKLYNLQTLRILSCQSLKKLPKGMSNLINLRHLHYTHWKELQMPLHMGKLTCLQTLETFVVGKEKGRQIGELKCLKNLKGELKICNLELVNGKEEAQRASLLGKPSIFGLALKWSEYREGEYDDENVLEGLQPHPNLKELGILNFIGHEFPPWLRVDLSTTVNRLVRLKLENCKRCTQIPVLGDLPFLEHLKLKGLDNITCIGRSFYGVNDCSGSRYKSFPALKFLHLESMPKLTAWMEVETKGEVVEVFPNLESLVLKDCSQLTTAPSHFPSLKHLEIESFPHVLPVTEICSKVTTLVDLYLCNITGFSHVPDSIFNNNRELLSLRLHKCPDLTHFMSASSNSLESLFLSECDNLRNLDISRFLSLRLLDIHNCSNLLSISVPGPREQRQLLSLRKLRITDCNGLTSIPSELVESCASIQSLIVYNCSNLVSFPIDLRYTPSLSSLRLYKCPKLITMPEGFGCSSSLRQLWVGPFLDSVELEWSSLSSSIRDLALCGRPDAVSLPDQLQNLTSLTRLAIWNFGIEAFPDWFGNLVSLEELALLNCGRLEYLPSIAAMNCLNQLSSLWISGCPRLKVKCSPKNGLNSEWAKISHISKITIDDVEIQ